MEIVTPSSGIVGGDKAALCDALADGLCPKINKLVIPGVLYGLESSLNAALRSRMEEGKGCCGLKSLGTKGSAYHLSPWLSSGACEALEELKIEAISTSAGEDLSEWLLRTKGPHLRALHLPRITTSTVMAALCSPGVAPMLHVLHLHVDHASVISFLTQAIGEGAWPYLRELGVPN